MDDGLCEHFTKTQCGSQYLSAPAGGENAAPKKAAEKGKGESAAFKPANVFGRKLETVPYMANPLPEHKVRALSSSSAVHAQC